MRRTLQFVSIGSSIAGPRVPHRQIEFEYQIRTTNVFIVEVRDVCGEFMFWDRAFRSDGGPITVQEALDLISGVRQLVLVRTNVHGPAVAIEEIISELQAAMNFATGFDLVTLGSGRMRFYVRDECVARDWTQSGPELAGRLQSFVTIQVRHLDRSINDRGTGFITIDIDLFRSRYDSQFAKKVCIWDDIEGVISPYVPPVGTAFAPFRCLTPPSTLALDLPVQTPPSFDPAIPDTFSHIRSASICEQGGSANLVGERFPSICSPSGFVTGFQCSEVNPHFPPC